ncbi:MAG: DNA-binding protein [Thermoplasmataceae archaeon]|uniref:DNA-binding TFAR19-related protein n=1 Tax=mine drainage metagenome TaxID=410659 RepID=T0YE00_9ZZZZ
MEGDNELDELRRRKMEEIQRSNAERQMSEEQQKAQEAERAARRQQVLRQILDPEARERLSNVRLVKPELAENVESQLIQLHGMGRINRVITDSEIRDILSKMTETKRETRIERRNK